MSLFGRNRFNFEFGSSGASTMAGLTDVSLTSPENQQTLLYNSTSGKWENGTLAGFDGTDTVFELFDDGDNTKKLDFELSGLTTGTTRTLTVPDKSGTLQLNEVRTLLSSTTISTTTYNIYFSDIFTSSYEWYVIMLRNVYNTGGTLNNGLYTRLLSSDTTQITNNKTGYTKLAAAYSQEQGGVGTTYTQLSDTGAKWDVDNPLSGYIIVKNPSTSRNIQTISSKLTWTDGYDLRIHKYFSKLAAADYSPFTATGIVISMNTAFTETGSSFNTGNIRVYGINNMNDLGVDFNGFSMFGLIDTPAALLMEGWDF